MSVSVTVEGQVGWIQLCRPDAMNALDPATVHGIARGVDQLGTDPAVRVVVITGSGRAFCAGADLKAIAEPDGSVAPDAVLAFVHDAAAMVRQVAALAKPVIAAVNGLALAGGLELAMACDLIVAAAGARLGDAHANYGLLPGAGGSARLPRIVGPTVAKHLLFTGASIPAAQLLAVGLVNEVVADAELIDRVTELAETLAAKSPVVLAEMKRLVDHGLDLPLDAALTLELEALDRHARGPEILEGLAAFREKRTPVFNGSLAQR